MPEVRGAGAAAPPARGGSVAGGAGRRRELEPISATARSRRSERWPLHGRIRRACDPMVWAVRPSATGVASGWLALLDIQPRQRRRSSWAASGSRHACSARAPATEAMFLLLRLAADELGYRRLVWKCNALNAPSRRAAERLGFTYEGRHRMHMVVKGPQPRHRLVQHRRGRMAAAAATRWRPGWTRRIISRTARRNIALPCCAGSVPVG